MPSEKEIVMIQKATMYDLIEILKASPDKAYTLGEIEQIIRAYLSGSDNNTK